MPVLAEVNFITPKSKQYFWLHQTSKKTDWIFWMLIELNEKILSRNNVCRKNEIYRKNVIGFYNVCILIGIAVFHLGDACSKMCIRDRHIMNNF